MSPIFLAAGLTVVISYLWLAEFKTWGELCGYCLRFEVLLLSLGDKIFYCKKTEEGGAKDWTDWYWTIVGWLLFYSTNFTGVTPSNGLLE